MTISTSFCPSAPCHHMPSKSSGKDLPPISVLISGYHQVRSKLHSELALPIGAHLPPVPAPHAAA